MPMTLGIDFGTTNSACAWFDGRDVELVPNDRGSRLTPSVVAFADDGEILVGESAKNQAILRPDRTVREVKRRLGSDWSIRIDGKRYGATETAALILSALKRDAESYLGNEIGQAVITVPANWTEAQRRATREAAEIAGLPLHRLLNEPAAAAVAWAWTNRGPAGTTVPEGGEGERIVLVYDLGGGTFDSALLAVRGGVCRVLASSGDGALGGADFDRLLHDAVVADLDFGRVDDPWFRQQLADAAERAKIELSTRPAAGILLPALPGGGGQKPWKIERPRFEALIGPLVDRTIGIVRNTLAEAGVAPAAVDALVFSGGSSRIPLVRRRMAELIGRPGEAKTNPEEIVAAGAAVFAAVAFEPRPDFRVLDALSRSFSVEIDGGRSATLLAKNAPYPAKRRRLFTTVADGQDTVEIHVLQGEASGAAENQSLGRFLLRGLAPAKRGEPRIELEFSVDADEILHVRAAERSSGQEQSLTIARAPDGARPVEPGRLESLAARARALAAAGIADRRVADELAQAIADAELALARGAADDGVDGNSALAAAFALEALIAELHARRADGA
jgi:molecular chaperone DnaK